VRPDDSRLETTAHAKTMNIELNSSFDTYWSNRPSKLRQNIRRYFRRLDNDARRVTLDVVSEQSALMEALNRYGEVESAGWKGKSGTAIHRTNAQGRFYADVLTRFSKDGNGRIYELYFDDQLAASRICISGGGLLVMLKTTYHESLRQYAPGRLLLYRLLEREFERRTFSKLEFYTDVTPDQASWSTSLRTIYHATQFRSSKVRSVARIGRRVRRLLAARSGSKESS
jgi:CelD/BcsL family acetyltransferase involved in cellulose biosynthesis